MDLWVFLANQGNSTSRSAVSEEAKCF